jgi:hypothetical protein
MNSGRCFFRRLFFSYTYARPVSGHVLRPLKSGHSWNSGQRNRWFLLDRRPLMVAALGIVVYNTEGPGGSSRLQEKFLKVNFRISFSVKLELAITLNS